MIMHKSSRSFLLLGLSPLLVVASYAQAPFANELKIIEDLGEVNGQALACQELKAAGRAKNLMIAHAPKTARFGKIYEESTQQSYATQIKGNVACPDGASFAVQLESISLRLKSSLPLTPGTEKP